VGADDHMRPETELPKQKTRGRAQPVVDTYGDRGHPYGSTKPPIWREINGSWGYHGSPPRRFPPVVWSTFGFIVLTTMLMSWALLFPFAVVDKMFTDVKLLQQPHIYLISIFGFTVKTFFPRWISTYFSSKSWFLEDDFFFPSTWLL